MRILKLDVARGLAIIGTLGTNIWLFSGIQDPEGSQTQIYEVFYGLSGIITNGKFLSLLAILFGMGIQLKYSSSVRKNNAFLSSYIWLMFLLLVEGILNYLFIFEYDVLMNYALVGIIVAILINKSDKVLYLTFLFSTTLHVLLQMYITHLKQITLNSALIIPSNSYLEQFLNRIEHVLLFRQEVITIIPMNIALFAFGAILVRKGILTNNKNAEKIQKKLMLFGFTIGLTFLVLGFTFNISDRYIAGPIISIGYLGLIFTIVSKGIFKSLQEYLSLIGKMALSNYILQNFLASIIFYAWGLGLYMYKSSYVISMVYIFICVVMYFVSKYWLHSYDRGPFELVWRKVHSYIIN